MKKAETFKFEVDEFRNPKKKLKISCYAWGKGEKTILLAHGWDARAMDFYKMIPVLVDHGYKVIAFDGPGHGHSEGNSSNMVDFKELMCKLIKQKIGDLMQLSAIQWAVVRLHIFYWTTTYT